MKDVSLRISEVEDSMDAFNGLAAAKCPCLF